MNHSSSPGVFLVASLLVGCFESEPSDDVRALLAAELDAGVCQDASYAPERDASSAPQLPSSVCALTPSGTLSELDLSSTSVFGFGDCEYTRVSLGFANGGAEALFLQLGAATAWRNGGGEASTGPIDCSLSFGGSDTGVACAFSGSIVWDGETVHVVGSLELDGECAIDATIDIAFPNAVKCL